MKLLRGRELHFRYNKKDMETAKQMYEDAIALDPKYATAYEHMALAIDAETAFRWSKSRNKDIERLFELSEKLLSLDDSSAGAHRVLSFYFSHRGQDEKAIAEAEKAIPLDPNNADGYGYVALALYRAGRFEEAIPWYEKALRRNPIPPSWVLWLLGLTYSKVGQYEGAIATLKKLINRDPAYGGAYMWLDVSYTRTGKHEEAINTCNKLINRDSTDSSALRICSYALSMAGRHEEAIVMVRKAINLGPQGALHSRVTLLAEYYRRIGQYEDAIDTSKKFLDSKLSDDRYEMAYITLTCAYSALGRQEDARAAAAEVLRLSPNFSLESGELRFPFYDWFLKHKADKELLLNALRKAGLK